MKVNVVDNFDVEKYNYFCEEADKASENAYMSRVKNKCRNYLVGVVSGMLTSLILTILLRSKIDLFLFCLWSVFLLGVIPFYFLVKYLESPVSGHSLEDKIKEVHDMYEDNGILYLTKINNNFITFTSDLCNVITVELDCVSLNLNNLNSTNILVTLNLHSIEVTLL